MKISIICVYNNEEIFQKQLYASLETQKIAYELIKVNNSSNVFKSASSALNYGVTISHGDILIFSHQDIFLKTEQELEKFARQIEKYEIGTVIGTQGVKEKSKKYYSNLTSGENYNSNLQSEFLDKPYEVDCVDEGFFGMKRETYNLHPFNEELCDNWHLYCVEVCLNARKCKHKVYVYPIQLHHYSLGKITLSYMKNLKQLCYVYGKDFKYIWTTCYKVRTNKIYINMLIFIWIVNRVLRGKSFNLI